MRLDAYLVANGLSRSRARAAEAIRQGGVTVNGVCAIKPSFEVDGTEEISVASDNERYVSRGGYKLERAISYFDIPVENAVCVDIGASTGGFTDCLLQNGAKSVLAIDSGSGQLNEKIAADSRVTSLENTNIRSYVPDERAFADLICVDVSFISLKLVLPSVADMLSQSGTAVCLIKPQFEAGRENIGKNGIVKDKKIHAKVIESVKDYAIQNGLFVTGVIESPVKGGDGNTEFLCKMIKQSKTDREEVPG